MLNVPAARQPWLGAVVVSTLTALAAAALYVPLIGAGDEPVNIRWADSATEADKQATAARYRLSVQDVRGDGVWIVRMPDASSATVRALVEDPRVADTHNIDRRDFEVVAARVTPVDWLARRSPAFAGVYDRFDRLGAAQVPVLCMVILGLVTLVTARRALAERLALLLPPLSPYGLATFRVAYGLGMIAVAWSVDAPPLPHEVHRLEDWAAQLPAVRDLAASETGLPWIRAALLAALCLFTVGALPRVTLVISAALMTIAAAVLLTHKSLHDWGLPLVTMWLLTLAPWQEGFGVSWSWRRWRGLPEPVGANPRGLALWIPGLALGVALAAAAYAKIDTSGLAWVTTGAVRYHFIEDAAAAPGEWGLRIAASEPAAIALSSAALAFEALFWLCIFVRRPGGRLLFWLAGAALYAGFYFFQGVFWPAWWVLLMAFLPWEPAVTALRDRLARRTVLIDGECPICRRTARILHAIDWFDRVAFADGSDDDVRARVAPGLTRAEALREMYVVEADGRRTGGYDGYLRLTRSMPLLWLVGLVGALPPIAAVGRAVYRRIAANRLRLGRCTDDICAVPAALLPTARREAPAARPLTRATVVALGLFVLQQVVVSALRIESEPLLSDFPMYAYTWPSREAFDAHLLAKTRSYALAAPALDEEALHQRLNRIPKATDVLAEAIDTSRRGAAWSSDLTAAVAGLRREYEEQFGELLDTVRVVVRERGFDWASGAFDRVPRVTFEGTLDIERGGLIEARSTLSSR